MVARSVARQLRTLQTHFPALVEAKFWLQRTYRAARRRPFEPEFALLKYVDVGSDRHIVDIGANRGQSIDAVRLYHPRARIVAFEANPELAQRLVRRFGRATNVTINAFGLADAIGRFPLHVPFYRGWMFDGLASLDRESAAGWLNEKRIAGFRRELLEIREVTCEVKRLDDQGLAPVFLKIDVQGAEAAVLRGGAETLRKYHPILLIEVDGEPPELLAELGYREFALRNGRLRPVTGPADRRSNNIFLTPRLDRTPSRPGSGDYRVTMHLRRSTTKHAPIPR